MSASLVGSEMCIRDSCRLARTQLSRAQVLSEVSCRRTPLEPRARVRAVPVSYTHLTLPTICSV
eukprot:3438871-Alexandrium_andersonii.AAC.1